MTSPTAGPDPTVGEFNRKAIGLTADFIEAAMDDASILEGIPSGAVVVLLPSDDPSFVAESIAMGVEAVRQGKDVVFRHVTRSGEPAHPSGSR